MSERIYVNSFHKFGLYTPGKLFSNFLSYFKETAGSNPSCQIQEDSAKNTGDALYDLNLGYRTALWSADVAPPPENVASTRPKYSFALGGVWRSVAPPPENVADCSEHRWMSQPALTVHLIVILSRVSEVKKLTWAHVLSFSWNPWAHNWTHLKKQL